MQNGQRIGCWVREGARLTRSLSASESRHFWADLHEINLLPGRDTIVLVGESTARGYLYDPAFTPAEGLSHFIGAVLPDAPFQILDLARTNASMEDVLTLLRAVVVLRPRTIIIWAGNNWFPLEDIARTEAPGVVHAIREGASALDLRANLEALHRRRVQAFIAEVGAIVRNIGAHCVVVIPEFNLLGWFDALAEAPPLAHARRVRWAETRRRLLHEQAAGDCSKVEALADELISLDDGLGSLGLHTKAMLCLQEDPARSRALLEKARDAELWPKSPRCHRITICELRESGTTQGFTVVDLPRRFADYCGAPLPSRDLFLDYCHHSQNGLRIACASIAEAVLQGSFGISVNWQSLAMQTLGISREIEARAQFLAAVHNSAHGQSADTLRYHIDEALKANPNVQTTIRQYVYHRLGCIPHTLAAGHLWDTQAERYFGPGGLRRGPLDIHLVNVILTRDAGLQNISELIAQHALSTKAVDLLAPSYSQLINMDESTLETCAYYRSRRSISSFIMVLTKKASVVLDLSYRTPDAETSSVVQVKCRRQIIARLPASNSWERVRLTVPASALEPGINFLRIVWPGSRLDQHGILARYADALELGESPIGPYPILGEIFTLRASL